MRVGWARIGDFRPISRRISETVGDTTKVTNRITNRKSNTRFLVVPKSTTSVDPWAAIMHSVALHTCVSGQPLKFA